MVLSLGSCSREKPNLHGQPLIAALGGNALGKAAPLCFTVGVFPPHKSSGQLKIKGKSRRLEKCSWKRLWVVEGYTVAFVYTASSSIWMEVQSTHSKMILCIHLNGTDFPYACFILNFKLKRKKKKPPNMKGCKWVMEQK